MHIGTLITMILCAVPLPAAHKSRDTKVDLRCGEYCLVIALKTLGIAMPSVDDIESRLGQPTILGYSIDQLDSAARSYGAFTLGLHTSLESLSEREGRFTCIALLEGTHHFVCIYDVDEAGVHIIDPPNERVVAKDAFRRVWAGKALIISDRPLKPTARLRGRQFIYGVIGIALIGVIAMGLRRFYGRWRS